MKEQQRAQYEAEMARLEREAEERERQRRLDEERDIQRKATKEKLEQIRQTPLGAKIFADMDEEVLEELDMDQILEKQIQHLEKEKKEMQEKLRQQEKKVHTVAHLPIELYYILESRELSEIQII